MEVLVALCRRPNVVVSSTELLEQCWNEAQVGDNPLHKTIAQLRRALGDDPVHPTYIETIRKRGYRAIAPVAAALPAALSRGRWTGGSPFRGLEAFGSAHAAVFFGRDAIVEELLAAVARQTESNCGLTLVLGPSGSGKTSLVLAGVLPRLMDPAGSAGVQVAAATTLDLGDLAELSLTTALAGALLDWELPGRPVFGGTSAHALANSLASAPGNVVAELQRALSNGKQATPLRRLALFVDRFEALFTAPQLTDAERQDFLLALHVLAHSGQVLVLIGCRNDFYPQLAAIPLLMEGKGRGAHFDLRPPSPAEIAQMVRLPALAAELSFGIEPATQMRLDELLCLAVADSPDALPLLQYTLHELYQLRGADGELSFAAYRQLGGVEGALAHRAEAILAGLQPAERCCLPLLLSRLVTVSADEERISSRRAPWMALNTPAERGLVEALVANRLLVSGLLNGEPGFGLAHEALLRHWPRVTQWVDAHRQALRVRARIGVLAKRWRSEGCPPDLLLPQGKQLDEAQELLSSPALPLGDEEQALIRASARRARRRRMAEVAAFGAVAGFALLAGVLGVRAFDAERLAQQRRAEAEGLIGYMVGDFADRLRPLGRLDLLDGISTRALKLLARPQSEARSRTEAQQHAKALQVIGEVHATRGHVSDAITALTEAENLLAAVADDGHGPVEAAADRLKTLGVVHFWRGQLHLDQNEWDLAAARFRQYAAAAEQLQRRVPGSVDAWIEQSYAHSSLGAVAQRRGDQATAVAEFQRSIELKQRALAQRPDDRNLKSELGNSLSWLATAQSARGELREALQLTEREVREMQALHTAAPQDAKWKGRLHNAYLHETRLLVALGRHEDALQILQRAAALNQALREHEPGDQAWQRSAYWIEHEQLKIALHQARAADVLPRLEALLQRLERNSSKEVRNEAWQWLASSIYQSAADAALHLRRGATADSHLQQALQRSESLYAGNPSNQRSRQAYVAALLTAAEIRDAGGDHTAAAGYCQKAQEVVGNQAGASRDYLVLDSWIRIQGCLGQFTATSGQRRFLADAGYRNAGYLRFLSRIQ